MKNPLFTLFFFMPLVTMLLSMNIGLVSGRCQSDQQSLLLNLKKTLVFYELASTKLVKWNSTPDCCEWPGIACDDGGSGRVISLDLSFEGITGGLDDSSGLFSLQFLQNLNLSSNSFNTPLPVRFANLTDLISLNLSNAWFIGQIPNDISKLTKLTFSADSFEGNQGLCGPPSNLIKEAKILEEELKETEEGSSIGEEGQCAW
ncbi:LEUCINE-RICH REPEAT RECEPTOR PROTEIN KINASE EMS1-LIKE [Salix purpurea]|uniref:LEUCINE-RICH REPEAT RECEPTOR PROTEIN KINASE EMS1-LIKE n=1 Tax=Salix purpurea TaxID=77065 RepID=A0A9Q1A2N4_SALPP|nr:LEUCINE-RICH REPEAT RECEPTOR PROTEIN KINASE EMS1-LIKE [Salix purpurea]